MGTSTAGGTTNTLGTNEEGAEVTSRGSLVGSGSIGTMVGVTTESGTKAEAIGAIVVAVGTSTTGETVALGKGIVTRAGLQSGELLEERTGVCIGTLSRRGLVLRYERAA